MKIVVMTGPTSFIGLALSRELLNRGYKIYAVVRPNSKGIYNIPKKENIVTVYADMESYGELADLISEKCDIGIALSWNGTRGQDRDDVALQHDSYRYSMDSVRAFAKLGCDVVMTAGSQAEYGLWYDSRKISELDNCAPNTEYGRNKLRFYQEAKEFCDTVGITLIEPRFFSLYGPGDFDGTLIISILNDMIAHRECRLTEGIQLWDFLYIDDAVDGLVRLLEHESANGVYNFGSGYSAPLREYIEEMRIITGSTSELRFGAVPYPKSGVVNTNPCIERLRAEVDWKPRVTFDDGIRRVIGRILDSQNA